MAKNKESIILEVVAEFLEVASLYLRLKDTRIKAQEQDASFTRFLYFRFSGPIEEVDERKRIYI